MNSNTGDRRTGNLLLGQDRRDGKEGGFRVTVCMLWFKRGKCKQDVCQCLNLRDGPGLQTPRSRKVLQPWILREGRAIEMGIGGTLCFVRKRKLGSLASRAFRSCSRFIKSLQEERFDCKSILSDRDEILTESQKSVDN